MIQCFTDSPAIADRLTTQMRDPDLLGRKEQGNLCLLRYSEVLSKNSASWARVETCKKVCHHVVRPTDSSYMRGVGSTVHAMMISKANFRRLGGSAVKAETEPIQ